jgi:hypothetical protein
LLNRRWLLSFTLSPPVSVVRRAATLTSTDLSSVVTKYIGETEKSLYKVSSSAEIADVSLSFDESDALFGEPTDAQDPNDPHVQDFIVLDLSASTWHGQMYVDFLVGANPGVYSLSGSIGSFRSVPEPGPLSLIAIALAAFAATRRGPVRCLQSKKCQALANLVRDSLGRRSRAAST